MRQTLEACEQGAVPARRRRPDAGRNLGTGHDADRVERRAHALRLQPPLFLVVQPHRHVSRAALVLLRPVGDIQAQPPRRRRPRLSARRGNGPPTRAAGRRGAGAALLRMDRRTVGARCAFPLRQGRRHRRRGAVADLDSIPPRRARLPRADAAADPRRRVLVTALAGNSQTVDGKSPSRRAASVDTEDQL